MTTYAKYTTLLYDGNCEFCQTQARKLKNLAGGKLAAESFQDPEVLKRFQGLTHEACMQEIKLITPQGSILGGADAIFYALSLYPLYFPLRILPMIPGINYLARFFYTIIANRRYKISQKNCSSGACFRPHPKA